MTKLLEKALEAVRRLSPADQDEIARTILTLTSGDESVPEDINPAHLPDVLEGLAQAKRRQFASDAEVEAAKRVRGDIYDALQNLILFPAAGRRQSTAGVRKLVTRDTRI